MILAPPIPLLTLVPELIVLVAACVVLVLGQARNERWRRSTPWIALGALALAMGVVWLGPRVMSTEILRALGSGLLYGPLADFVRISALELGVLITLVNWSQGREAERGEFLAMMLLSILGLLLVGAADNLAVLFLAIELVSVPTYIMVVLSRTSLRALEAGTKYFYLGAMSAAVMAYGFAFLYGVSGTMSLSEMVPTVTAALREPGTLRYGLATIGVVLAIGGLLFKIAAVPLHFYLADVYHGAASSVAGLLGFVPKLAGFVALLKIVLLTGEWNWGGTPVFWLLWIVAALSMTVGNVLALRQTNVKRLLAYSGIAHSGYMLVGLLAGPLAGSRDGSPAFGTMGNGAAAVLYYVVVYGIANLGAFAVLGLLRVRDEPCETLRDLAGLLKRHAGLALLLALSMFTLLGLPPTPGFWGKLSLFGSALAAGRVTAETAHGHWLVALVIIAVLNSAISAAYYLRVVAAVLLFENEHPARATAREAQHVGALLCGFLLLIFSIYPTVLLAAGRLAADDLTPALTLPDDAALRSAAATSPPG